jgi:hypothetical protein
LYSLHSAHAKLIIILQLYTPQAAAVKNTSAAELRSIHADVDADVAEAGAAYDVEARQRRDRKGSLSDLKTDMDARAIANVSAYINTNDGSGSGGSPPLLSSALLASAKRISPSIRQSTSSPSSSSSSSSRKKDKHARRNSAMFLSQKRSLQQRMSEADALKERATRINVDETDSDGDEWTDGNAAMRVASSELAKGVHIVR